MDKLIVTVAPTSNFHGKEANPALPFTPQEVADAVYECWNEGASIVHIHGRNETGLPTNDPGFFQEVDSLIREKKCDIIIQHSMAPANPLLLGLDVGDVDDGVRTSTTDPPPEMVSLEVAPSNIIWKGKVVPMPWNRLWAERVAKDILERGIKPETEIYNNSDMDDLDYLIDKGVFKKTLLRQLRLRHAPSEQPGLPVFPQTPDAPLGPAPTGFHFLRARYRECRV